MIKPTPGRIVWYRPQIGDVIPSRGEEPLAAMVAGVISDTLVNLAVTGADGSGPYARQNVTLVQDGETPPGACTWMPFQKGQAVKTEELARVPYQSFEATVAMAAIEQDVAALKEQVAKLEVITRAPAVPHASPEMQAAVDKYIADAKAEPVEPAAQ